LTKHGMSSLCVTPQHQFFARTFGGATGRSAGRESARDDSY
jgi:hypothetical protein